MGQQSALCYLTFFPVCVTWAQLWCETPDGLYATDSTQLINTKNSDSACMQDGKHAYKGIWDQSNSNQIHQNPQICY